MSQKRRQEGINRCSGLQEINQLAVMMNWIGRLITGLCLSFRSAFMAQVTSLDFPSRRLEDEQNAKVS